MADLESFSGLSSSMNLFAFTLRQDGTQWGETTLTGTEKIEGTVQCVSTSGRPGHATIQVRGRTKKPLIAFVPYDL